MTAGAMVISYWIPTEKVNAGVWITIFLVTVVAINYFGVKFFGEFEFWLSSFKVVVILGIILLSFILMLGGGPDHDRKGFRYWKSPGAFNHYKMEGAPGRFLAFWSTMVSATFAYLGTELVGVTVGEAQNPRKTIPRAIKLTFYRILVFYVTSVLLVGTLVPYNSPSLLFALSDDNTKKGSAAASPFVVAVELAAIPALLALPQRPFTRFLKGSLRHPTLKMATLLSELCARTRLDCDTMDLDFAKKFGPFADATSNQVHQAPFSHPYLDPACQDEL